MDTEAERAKNTALIGTETRLPSEGGDLKALRDAVLEAASISSGLWLSYLFVLFYLGIAAAGVSHRDLLYENPVKLPFLNIDLPLIGFFLIAPCLLVVVHGYVLLHFVLLADKIGTFDAELTAQIDDKGLQTRLRRQLPINIFVQLLAGPPEVRCGIIGFLLRAIAQISLVIAPVCLLILILLQFLPYHSWPLTMWHRTITLIDLFLLWRFWPSIAQGSATRLSWKSFQRPAVAASSVLSCLITLFVFTVFTFPGEWLDANLPPLHFIPTKWPALGENNEWPVDRPLEKSWKARILRYASDLADSIEPVSLHELLVNGDIDLVARKPRSLWSNRLVLPGLSVIDYAKVDTDAKIAALPETLSLRGRRLEGAVFIGAILKKVDFTAAHLQRAVFSDADLRGARFGCDAAKLAARYSGGTACVLLQEAKLDRALLQGLVLDSAQLDHALLDNAQLQEASLRFTHLKGATLSFVQLQRAKLDNADLSGATLFFANLQCASLKQTNLNGAFLDYATVPSDAVSSATDVPNTQFVTLTDPSGGKECTNTLDKVSAEPNGGATLRSPRRR
jgi:uncharacterized protein YjbI with pentapeptide repeats